MVMGKWELVQTTAGKKKFNSFFMGYKTSKDVSDALYKKGRKVKIVPEVTKYTTLFRKNHYLDEDRVKRNVRRPVKNKYGKVIRIERFKTPVDIYRGNIMPFLDWLDDETEKMEKKLKISKTNLKYISILKESLKKYLKDLFETLDKNGVSRSKIMKDKDVDIITTIQTLVLTIQKYVAEDFVYMGGEHLEKYIQIHNMEPMLKFLEGEDVSAYYPLVLLQIEKEDNTFVKLPNPYIFFNNFMRDFIKIIFPKKIELRVEKDLTSDKEGYTPIAVIY